MSATATSTTHPVQRDRCCADCDAAIAAMSPAGRAAFVGSTIVREGHEWSWDGDEWHLNVEAPISHYGMGWGARSVGPAAQTFCGKGEERMYFPESFAASPDNQWAADRCDRCMTAAA